MYSHSNPIPHRRHKKSTTGCKACKIRKVKCDEKRPVCGKCEVHFSNIQGCDYGQPTKFTKKKSALDGLPKNPQVTGPQSRNERIARVLDAINEAPGSSLSQHFDTVGPPDNIGKVTPYPQNYLLSFPPHNSKTTVGHPCRCPCHQTEFTEILLDAVFRVCRICGNSPSLSSSSSTCISVVPATVLMSGKVDPFGVLPAKQSPRVHALMFHWVNTLSSFPTLIHSQYCTNKSWISTALANKVLFNATLFVSSVHLDDLHGHRESSESLYYKLETIRVLNEALEDPMLAVADETISAVLLLGNIISIIGEPSEVQAHLNGLQKMISLRGGIKNFAIEGTFLHMLCTTNHLTAVLSESHHLIPPTGIPYKPATSPRSLPVPIHESPLFKPFAIESGFHTTVVDIFHEIGYLYAVLNAFTLRLLPDCRKGFEELAIEIERSSKL